jgi:lipoprotein LprG
MDIDLSRGRFSMAGMSRTLRAVAALSLFAIVLTGCSKKNKEASPSELPTGTQLMADGAKAMGEVKTVHFTLGVTGKISGLTIHGAEGDLTKEGNAKGKAKIEQLGLIIESEFVMVGKDLYLKGPTGGFQQLPASMAATVYDPSAILDPNRGAPKLLTTAKNPKTEAKEQLDGKEVYRVSFEPDTAALQALVGTQLPGVKGLVWLDAATKRIAKAEFKVPPSGGNPEGTVTVTFTKYDEPVTIVAP